MSAINNSRVLTNFQKVLLDKLKKALFNSGHQLIDEKVSGQKESYIYAKIQSLDIEIWIYKDSAEFTSSEKIDCRYESVDYDSSEDLVDTYIEDLLAKYIKQKINRDRPRLNN